MEADNRWEQEIIDVCESFKNNGEAWKIDRNVFCELRLWKTDSRKQVTAYDLLEFAKKYYSKVEFLESKVSNLIDMLRLKELEAKQWKIVAQELEDDNDALESKLSKAVEALEWVTNTQKKWYGNATELHIEMLDWPEKMKALSEIKGE